MYNVTLTHIRVTSTAMEKQRVSLWPKVPGKQRACIMLYCHLWPAWLYNIFPHYLINGMIFFIKKK